MSPTLRFVDDAAALDAAGHRVFIGRRDRLLAPDVRARVPAGLREGWEALVRSVDPGDDGQALQAWWPQGRVVVGVLPERCSRHNTPTRAPAIARLAALTGPAVGVLVALDDAEHAWAAAMAVAQAYPTTQLRSAAPRDRTVDVALLALNGALPPASRLAVVAEARRRAAAWVDLPPSHLHVPEMVDAARRIAGEVGAGITLVEGEALARQGLGGLWGVGRASVHPPALVVLSYAPPDRADGPSVGLVGKGIVYDTGGLSLKGKFDMPGMKNDMGGAAAVLAAFEAAARLGLRRRITAALCLAENAVGPTATRPDDVITLYSGRTVEVNNTDAEGRLVLADGLVWLARHHRPDRLIDLATLTGAQLVATGKRHAAVVSSDADLEAEALDIGRRTGDLVHALPFSPEIFRREFASPIADMKNSVKDRSNAQSSCAAQFLHEHLHDHPGPWLHVDMAGPVVREGRGTGYGVGLALGLLGLLAG